MLEGLLSWPMWAVAIVFTVVGVVFAASMVIGFRPLIARYAGDEHNTIFGNSFAAVSTLFAIVAGLLIFAVVGAFSTASIACSNEAAGLTQMYRNVEVFPQPEKAQAQRVIKDYTTSVVKDEFPTLAKGERSPETGKAMDTMFATIGPMSPDKTWSDQYTVVARKMTDIVALRDARIESSQPALAPIYLVVLFISGGVTLACLALLKVGSLRMHIFAVGLVAATIAMVLFVMVEVNRPFSGEVSVGPDSFLATLRTIARLTPG